MASAHGIRRAYEVIRTVDVRSARVVKVALEEVVKTSPPAYCKGWRYLTDSEFKDEQSRLAELYHMESFPNLGTPIRHTIWSNAPYLFDGFADVRSRTNYLIARHSPLARRLGLTGRYFGRRELLKRLQQITSVTPVRHTGPHEIWKAQNGALLEIPVHPRDLSPGVEAKIIKAATGLSRAQFAEQTH